MQHRPAPRQHLRQWQRRRLIEGAIFQVGQRLQTHDDIPLLILPAPDNRHTKDETRKAA